MPCFKNLAFQENTFMNQGNISVADFCEFGFLS